MSTTDINPTPLSLLRKLREPETGRAAEAWRRFVQLYTPLLLQWARRVGAAAEDAADLVQDVFAILARRLPVFEHDSGRRFRGWLWTVLLNKWRDRVRSRSASPTFVSVTALETVATDDRVEELIEREYRSYLLARALKIMQAELPPVDWQACHEYAIRGRPADEVARELGLSVNQVYLAKSRILRRLREELEGLLN